MTPDSELLVHFARTNSEDAFAELVKRHVNLVYSAALRQVNGDEHLAKDVAQTVFADLACKAASLARRETLTGWLYTSAHFAAAKIIRTETRRRDREEKFMREPIHETALEPDWEKLRPVLDGAMHELKAADREAILLRYFENQPFTVVGLKLGLNENAARMRVERALEKLRAILAQRGLAVTATLASVISANAVQLAPVGLATTLTTVSLVSAGTGAITFLKLMTAVQLKLTVATLIVAGTAAALLLQHQTQEKLRTNNAALAQQLTQLQADNRNLSNQITVAANAAKLTDDQFKELLKLRGEVGVLRRQANDLKKAQQAQADKDEENRQMLAAAKSEAELARVKDQFNADEARTINFFKQIGLAERIYANANQNQFPTNPPQLIAILETTNLMQFVSEKVEMRVRYEKVQGQMQLVNTLDHPESILLCEKMCRQDFDGKWRRLYLLGDGSVLTAVSDKMNFDEWERLNTK